MMAPHITQLSRVWLPKHQKRAHQLEQRWRSSSPSTRSSHGLAASKMQCTKVLYLRKPPSNPSETVAVPSKSQHPQTSRAKADRYSAHPSLTPIPIPLVTAPTYSPLLASSRYEIHPGRPSRLYGTISVDARAIPTKRTEGACLPSSVGIATHPASAVRKHMPGTREI